MLKISIIDGHHVVQQRNTKSGIRFYQLGYAHLGGAFPSQIEIPLRNAADAFVIGDYQLDISNFQVGRFKNLELNPFQITLRSIEQSRPTAAKTAA